MVDSGVGRTDGAEVGHRRAQAGALAKAQDREMWKPWTLFAPIDADRLEPLLQFPRDSGCAVVLVLEDEHADASRLAVPEGSERRSRRTLGARSQRVDDGGQISPRSRAEERERDVEIPSRDDPPGEVLSLPTDDPIECAGGQREAAEESKAIMAADASGVIHTPSSRLCVRSVRRR